MSKNVVILLGLTLILVAGAALCVRPGGRVARAATSPPPMSNPESHILEEPIRPLPETVDLDAAKVALGRALFFDVRLSHDNSISCASCHSLDKAGTDRLPHSVGIGGAVGAVNAPTVLNSGFNFVQFWNGRAATLEDQVNGPTHNPKEMGSDWKEILGKLRADGRYSTLFHSLYADGVQAQNVRDAISTFERSLVTPDSRFDAYLKGDTTALDAVEVRGYQLFKRDGCVSCHQGQNVGGNMYQKVGVMGDYFAARGAATEADLGRYAVTGRAQDKYVFRVPSLRNVALTAPYFHDGSATTLPEAVEMMSIYQLGRPLRPEELDAIVRFLGTLNGRQPGGRPK